MQSKVNKEFEFLGVNHLAPTVRCMKETVEFYGETLGMPLTMTTQFGEDGKEQQVFFFDIGNGSHIAFMWSANAVEAAPGVASPAGFIEETTDLDLASLTPEERAALPSTSSAIGSVNHIALNIPIEKFDDYRQKLIDKGIRVSTVRYHTLDEECRPIPTDSGDNPVVFMQSIYFHDPNGIQLEFAAWTRAMRPHEARLSPMQAKVLSSS